MSLTFDELHAASAKRGIEWMGGPATLEDLSFTAVELGGETGEALDAVKKFLRWLKKARGGVGPQESHQAIAEELADVVISAQRVAEAMGIDLGAAVVAKFNVTSEKYGLSVKL